MCFRNGISLSLSCSLRHPVYGRFNCSCCEVPSLLSCSFSHSLFSVSQEQLLILNSRVLIRGIEVEIKEEFGLSSMGSSLIGRFDRFGESPLVLLYSNRIKMSTLDYRVLNRDVEEAKEGEMGCFGDAPNLLSQFNQYGELGLRRKISTLDYRVSNRDMVRSMSSLNHHCLLIDRYSESPFVRPYSNWSLDLVLGRNMKTLSSRVVNCRNFCMASDVDSDMEGEKEGVEDDDGGEENESHKSKANPKEVERVCRVIEELFASDRNMEAVLDQCGIDLSHDFVVDVLSRFQHARRPAFRFFCWAGEKPDFEHDSRTYNSMMRILGKMRQFESMVGMLEEMGKKGLLTIETFSIAIRAFAAERETKKVMGIFELMKRHNFKTGVDTFNCLLDALGRAKLGKEAQAVFEKLKGRFTPDLKTYSVLLAGWCKVRNLVEAGRVWNEIVDMGMKPDIVTHNIMLEGLLKARRNSEAIKLFELMKAKGPSPNVRSYTILIRDLCKANKMDLAVEYFDEMLDAGCNPDPAVYTCLMVGFGNQKQMYKVYGLLKEMTKKGCPPDGRTYNALIKMMTNREMPDNAVRIYKKMVQSGYQPTIHTYNMMMKSYFQMKNYEMGSAVWDEMIRKGCCPDDNSYTVFIGGLIRVGRSEEACKYIEEMIEKGMKAPQLDYNKFSADFSRAGKPNILEELAQKMKFSGKFEESNVFARWSDMMKNRVRQRHPDKVRRRST